MVLVSYVLDIWLHFNYLSLWLKWHKNLIQRRLLTPDWQQFTMWTLIMAMVVGAVTAGEIKLHFSGTVLCLIIQWILSNFISQHIETPTQKTNPPKVHR